MDNAQELGNHLGLSEEQQDEFNGILSPSEQNSLNGEDMSMLESWTSLDPAKFMETVEESIQRGVFHRSPTTIFKTMIYFLQIHIIECSRVIGLEFYELKEALDKELQGLNGEEDQSQLKEWYKSRMTGIEQNHKDKMSPILKSYDEKYDKLRILANMVAQVEHVDMSETLTYIDHIKFTNS